MSRLSPAISSCVIAVIVLLGPRCAEASVLASHVGCPAISVESLDRSVAFYTGLLEFKEVGIKDSSPEARLAPAMSTTTQARTAHLTLGDECLDVTEYTSPRGRPFPSDSQGSDRWFEHIAIAVSDMDKAYARLHEARVRQVSNTPQTLPQWNRDAAGIAAFYFRDPDGHYLELIHFPPGKGQAKWQTTSQSLFLGIDHTAIVVSDTRRTLAFYRDKLHLRVVGTSENYGIEQEHLSGVFNAHVLITSLRAESGIGIELLDYVTPTEGRPIPADLRINDLACWQIPVSVTVSPGANDEDILRSANWVSIPTPSDQSNSTAWIHDPDGHLVELSK